MYDIFGEFDSAKEINLAAAGLLAETDIQNIYVLAKENGIDKEIAEAYIEGEIPYLTDDTMAGIGKLYVEKEKANNSIVGSIKEGIAGYLQAQCIDAAFAKRIRQKGKSLNECLEYTGNAVEKALKRKNGALIDKQVYGYAKDYYDKEK